MADDQELLANTDRQIAEYRQHVANQEAKLAELSAKGSPREDAVDLSLLTPSRPDSFSLKMVLQPACFRDHRHFRERLTWYDFESPVKLMEDFWEDLRTILEEEGVPWTD